MHHSFHPRSAGKCAVLFALLFFAAGCAVMWLWNWLVPALFHGPGITLWQSLGLLALTRLLVGHGRRCGWRGSHPQAPVDTSTLSEEERNKLRTCLFNKWRC